MHSVIPSYHPPHPPPQQPATPPIHKDLLYTITIPAPTTTPPRTTPHPTIPPLPAAPPLFGAPALPLGVAPPSPPAPVPFAFAALPVYGTVVTPVPFVQLPGCALAEKVTSAHYPSRQASAPYTLKKWTDGKRSCPKQWIGNPLAQSSGCEEGNREGMGKRTLYNPPAGSPLVTTCTVAFIPSVIPVAGPTAPRQNFPSPSS